MKKIVALLLVVIMAIGLFAGCTPAEKDNTKYTYNTYMSAFATNWNPHTWEMDADSSIMSYIETPLADITVKDSAKMEYQWIFVAATDIKDVTADHQDDLTKYAVTLPSGKTAEEITKDYVYEIKLREAMCWQDGTPINADTYIYSMQQLLNPKMKNYRANNYYTGTSALAGAYAYYNQGAPIYATVLQDGVAVDVTGKDLYLNLTAAIYGGYSLYDLYDYGYIADADYTALDDATNIYGYILITEELMPHVLNAMDGFLSGFGGSIYVDPDAEEKEIDQDMYNMFPFYDTGKVSDAVSYDTVGLYKVDDYTIRYVCQTAYEYYYFLTSCTSNWLVKEDLYEACKKQGDNGLITSNYGTSLATTASYGPYKMTVLQDDKQVIFVQNEKYWEYTKNEDGTLSSTTFFEVDGKTQPQYITEKIVINKMSDDAAKLAFLSGALDDWSLSAEDAVTYATSEQLYQVDETYTMRLFFHTKLESLKKMDEDGTNTNGVVLSNDNFRKALSLAIKRSEYVTATAGFKPACFLINSLYYYDVYNDPSSIYRNTDEAMQAVCNLYGIEYGEGKAYATLEEAYASVTGYNLTEAQALMALACDELVAAGLYTEGEDISIKIALSASTADSSDLQQVALLNQYINAAVEGSGFGKVEFTYADNLNDRYGDVIKGTYAVGRGAWGGAAFYPFGMFQVYCDPDYTKVHEIGCWDPAKETLTLTVEGQEVTMTWQKWSQSMEGTGEFANSSNEVKLQILADLEQKYLEKYYCIPLCTYTACSMLSYKTNNYTDNYSIMYGFGGLRLMTYNYTNAEWAQFVKDAGGTLSY